MVKAETARKSSGRRSKSRTRVHSVHPLVIRLAVVGAVWFLIVIAISFSGTIEADYLLAVVIGFSVIFFTLVLGLARRAANRGGREDDAGLLTDFLKEKVAIDRGVITGREATIQILMLPVTLAVGAMILGFIYVIGA